MFLRRLFALVTFAALTTGCWRWHHHDRAVVRIDVSHHDRDRR